MNWHISCVNSYMKLYIISNRLPVKVTKEDETFVFSRSEGGLATGLDSLQNSNSLLSFPDYLMPFSSSILKSSLSIPTSSSVRASLWSFR